MAKLSAGLIPYRVHEGELQVLLVHPGGPFWKNKDAGAWSIPKGEVMGDEDPLAAAVREFQEETGWMPHQPFVPLGAVTQKGGKKVLAWAFAGDADPATLASNVFEIVWPPRSGRLARFPEVDRAAFFNLVEARSKLVSGQASFLDALASALPDAAAIGPDAPNM